MSREDKDGAAERQVSFGDYDGDDGSLAAVYGKLNDPSQYSVGGGLRGAVEAALILGQPLLITGAPGTGKTQLAARIAYERGLPKDDFPLTFNTKSTSTARDLFYQYDALAHFQDAQMRPEGAPPLAPHDYITYEALGLAIILSLPPENDERRAVNDYLPEGLRNIYSTRSVVLIDEIDKAPRDMPNDVLNEIDRMSFTVRELKSAGGRTSGLTLTADQNKRPIVLITSNSERDLPDAFVRRCVYYHIDFPEEPELLEIVGRRLGFHFLTRPMWESSTRLFLKLRGVTGPEPRYKPSTAELLSWLRLLEALQINVLEPSQTDDLEATYTALSKNQDDLRLFRSRSRGLVEEVRKEEAGAEADVVGQLPS